MLTSDYNTLTDQFSLIFKLLDPVSYQLVLQNVNVFYGHFSIHYIAM